MNKHDVYLITGRGDTKGWLAKKLFGYESHINPTCSVPDDGLPVILTADKLSITALVPIVSLRVTPGKVVHLSTH